MEVKEYKEEEYRIIFGVTKTTFLEMVRIMEIEFNKTHSNGGRKDGSSP